MLWNKGLVTEDGAVEAEEEIDGDEFEEEEEEDAEEDK
jgi:hypothetical protein